MKHKICIVIDHLGLGGAQTQLFEYLKKADRSVFDVSIVSLDPGKNLLVGKIESLGYEIKEIPQQGFFDNTALRELKEYFIQTKPDIVQTYLFTADCYGRLAAKMAGVKRVVCSIRAVDQWKKPHHLMVDKILSAYTDMYTINAEGIRPFLIEKSGLGKSKIQKIYNGVDMTRFEDLRDLDDIRAEFMISPDYIVIGMIGRLSEPKDHRTLFKAAQTIIQSNPKIKLLIIGEGPLQEKLKQEVKDLGIDQNVIFTGYRKDVPDLIQLMDVGVLVSHFEGCPNVVMEYMASGKPAVASDVGGAREVVVEGKTGFTVPDRDVEELTDRLNKLIEDESLRKSLGRKGRERISEEFSSDLLAQRMERMYRELLRPKIAFLLSQFPEMHETFILREFNGQKDKGMNFEIYSYKRCKDEIIHPEAEALIPMTVYPSPFPLWSLFYILGKHPIRFLKSFGYMLSCMFRHWSKPMDVLKIVVIFVRSIYFARIMEKRYVTHIHAHWATMPTTGAEMISRMIGVSFSFTAHAWDIYLNEKDELKEKIQNSKFTVTCTKANKSFIDALDEAYLGRKVFVNYHGVNLSKFNLRQQPALGREALILAIGRLVEQKGFEYLIKACGVLKRRSIPFRCVIIGNGPLQTKLENLIENFGLREQIELPGSVGQDRVHELFREADVFAAPCVISKNGDRDGIPNVLLEAFSVGVPIVGTNVSGLPEVLVDGETGIVVRERDERALAKGLEGVITRKVPVQKFVKNGRLKMEQEFDMYKNVEQLIGIFKQHGLIGGNGEQS